MEKLTYKDKVYKMARMTMHARDLGEDGEQAAKESGEMFGYSGYALEYAATVALCLADVLD